MSKSPSRAFTTAFVSAMANTAVQAARHEVISKRMSAAAMAVISGLMIAMTAAPAPAQAQNTNSVSRTAIDVIGGVVGGALGSRIGGGNGRKAAMIAGSAAGVWAAESMQPGSQQGRSRTTSMSNDSFGPAISPGWSNTRVPTSASSTTSSRTVLPDASYTRLPDRQATLQSGTTQMSDERMSKLVAMEGTFLAARDAYARAIYASEQADDDAVLDGGGRDVQQKLSGTRAHQRQAQTDFDAAKGTFVTAVEHMGQRGYDVHYFAHSHNLAMARVTSADMSRGDVVRVTRGARIVEQYDETDSVRGESYTHR